MAQFLNKKLVFYDLKLNWDHELEKFIAPDRQFYKLVNEENDLSKYNNSQIAIAYSVLYYFVKDNKYNLTDSNCISDRVAHGEIFAGQVSFEHLGETWLKNWGNPLHFFMSIKLVA